jgi:hypothetical protein
MRANKKNAQESLSLNSPPLPRSPLAPDSLSLREEGFAHSCLSVEDNNIALNTRLESVTPPYRQVR